MDRQDLATAQKLQEIHNQAYREVQKKVDGFINKYADAAGVSIEEARKIAFNTDISKLEGIAKKYVNNKDFSPEANEFMRTYNYVGNITRLELLRNDVGLTLMGLGSAEEDIIRDSLSKAAVQELETNMGIFKDLKYSGKPVESIVNASFHGANWSRRIWNSMEGLRDELDKELRKALTFGTGYPVPAALKKRFGVSTHEAERLAYTELTRVRIDARLQRFADNGVGSYKYNAIVDSRTSDVCLALNGAVFKLEEGEAGVNLPPMHPYCRSSVLPVREQLDTAIEETPEESLKFAEEMLAKNPDSQLWKDIVDYQRNRVNRYSLNGLRAPVRPNSDDYPDYDSYLVARNQYRAEKDKYLAYIQQQADLADRNTPHITFEEGMELLKKRGLTPDGLKDLEGSDYRVLLDLAQVHDEVMAKYPFLKKYDYKTMDGGTISTGVNYVAGAKPGDTYEAAFGNAAMYIGVDSFKSYPDRVSSVLESMGAKWYVEGDGTYKSIYRHEFGHAMDDYIQNKIRDGKESPEYSAKLAEYTNELLSLRESDGVSVYSYTTAGETFAEGFSAYEGGQDTEFAKRFGDFLKKWV